LKESQKQETKEKAGTPGDPSVDKKFLFFQAFKGVSPDKNQTTTTIKNHTEQVQHRPLQMRDSKPLYGGSNVTMPNFSVEFGSF